MRNGQSTTLSFRITEAMKKKFFKKTEKLGGSSYVLREILSAYVEGRVAITPPVNKLYSKENHEH